MTEKEAAQMPCIGPHPENTGRRLTPSGSGETIFVCSGSRCGMAWRWLSIGMRYEHTGYGGTDRGKGYCGLAGAPNAR